VNYFRLIRYGVAFFTMVAALCWSTFPMATAKTADPTKSYIVILHDQVTNSDSVAFDLAIGHQLAIGHTYKTALKGFSAEMPASRVNRLQRDARVKAVIEDREVHSMAQTIPTGVRRVDAPTNPNKGSGIGIAVLDTGIDLNHSDLKTNTIAGTNCVRPRRAPQDDNGHGTHVAGTIAAVNNTTGVVGVAPAAKVIAVKVLGPSGSGSWSQVICGIDWVTAHATQYNIKVANMSLGGGGTSDNNCGNTNNDALHQAICNSVAAGVTYVVAAGNSASNASTSVPAAYNDAVITVSALADSDGLPGGFGAATGYGADDTFASFSNFGSPVDIAAPGVSIYSTYRSGGYTTLSGTSMASPHVAGAAALYIKSHPGASWTDVRSGLIGAAEALGADHTDPSGLHPEPVLLAGSL